MSASMQNRVASWLKDQGYPLEMAVARIARAVGFDVSQSDYYIDPESEVPREIDLMLNLQGYDQRFSPKYSIFVECKSSRDKPWIIFVNSHEKAPTKLSKLLQLFELHSACISNELAQQLLQKFAHSNEFQHIYPRLNSFPMLGYGVTQAFANGSEVPFKALMSATKAAISHVRRFNTMGLSIPFVLAIPVVVIDAPLFSVSASVDSDDITLENIGVGVLHWKQVVAGTSGNGVYIVTREALPSFLTRCFESAQWWTNLDPEAFNEVYSEKNSDGRAR